MMNDHLSIASKSSEHLLGSWVWVITVFGYQTFYQFSGLSDMTTELFGVAWHPARPCGSTN